MRRGRGRARSAVLGAVLLAGSVVLGGCAEVQGAAPRCSDVRRVAVVAQSVPGARYVPCLNDLRPGWTAQSFDPRSGRTRFELVSDRDTDHPVAVEYRTTCSVEGATATTARADGARTFLLLRSVEPRYSGTLIDVFTGGCVTYAFDFARGPHIALIDDFENEIGLLARRDLALSLHNRYDVDLEP